MIEQVEPIGYVRSTRSEAVDDGWDEVTASIGLDADRYDPRALAGLEDFSHVEVVYLFHRVDPDSVQRGARRPRNNPAWPEVGIFAQRGKNRPNRLGVTVCALTRVTGLTLTVTGLDAIDGTPVLDIKPWMAEFGPRGPVRQPPWSHELMTAYWR
ncbi:SAM-dependent methyltransferase [Pseudonocardia acaciae]|uniref:SAM-dependent methyltransferase n=1 Tax=Pseudonocardia acaciae TaxID=551276 RepID=UPI00048BFCD4|nr:SAM-dependent methyltransferase [Pseudonocardia acaciae]